ncbi:MAG TPA: response regulator [Rhizomicrobium sp.]|nr:response regulator [Rhizomicrobium sp.]
MPRRKTKIRPSPASSETVLVAEPDVLARMVLAEYLRECGYEVMEAGSAEEVLSVLGWGRKIGVVLLNSQISQGKGFELAREIRENHPGIDIVLTFGIAKSAEKASEICDGGPQERPYHPQEVVRRIQQLRGARKVAPD